MNLKMIDGPRAVVYRSTAVGKRTRVRVAAEAACYESASERDIRSYQTDRVAKIWDIAQVASPFYRHWRQRYRLPSSLRSLEELASFPSLAKTDLQDAFELVDFTNGRGPYLSTGGSTGEPIHLPIETPDIDDFRLRVLLSRSRIGVRPGDRYVHLWGHSHLFGSGLNRVRRKSIRGLSDWVVGATRINAYDQSDENLARTARVVTAKNPYWIVGYSSALKRLAQFLRANHPDWELPPDLRVVVNTADEMPPRDRDLVEAVFGVPCISEYGAAETGIMAYGRAEDTRLDIYWRSFVLNQQSGEACRITTLGRRRFPLINYDLRDVLEHDGDGSSIVRATKLLGRADESVTMGGKSVMATLLAQVFKTWPSVRAVQFYQEHQAGAVEVLLSSDSKLPLGRIREFGCEELKRSLGVDVRRDLIVAQVDRPELSQAGKALLLLSGRPEILHSTDRVAEF